MTDLQKAAERALNLIEVYSPEYMHGESKKTHVKRLRYALAESANSTTSVMESEIKRLQELADYRLKLLTKMPSEWVGLADEDIAELRRNGAHSISDADFRTIEARLKEKNCG